MHFEPMYDGSYGGGVRAVDLTWTGSGHSFFLPSSGPFFTLALSLPPPLFRRIPAVIARCDVTRGGVIGACMCGPARGPGGYLLRNPSNPFLESREKSKVTLPSHAPSIYAAHVITPSERSQCVIKFPLAAAKKDIAAASSLPTIKKDEKRKKRRGEKKSRRAGEIGCRQETRPIIDIGASLRIGRERLPAVAV